MSRPAFTNSDDIVGRCQYCDVAQYDATAVDCWKCDQPWKDTDDTEEVSDNTESESE